MTEVVNRLKPTADARRVTQSKPVWPRLMAKRVIDANGCWVHQSTPDGNGYCSISVNARRVKVHRWIYERVVGSIPAGYEVDHLCRNRRCFNPDHLEAVTQAENNRRSTSITNLKARQTHCAKGHPLSGENLILESSGPSRRPARRCRICNAARFRAMRTRRRSANG